MFVIISERFKDPVVVVSSLGGLTFTYISEDDYTRFPTFESALKFKETFLPDSWRIMEHKDYEIFRVLHS